MTDTRVVGDCIGQGTAGAALVSQVNLDKGLTEYLLIETVRLVLVMGM